MNTTALWFIVVCVLVVLAVYLALALIVSQWFGRRIAKNAPPLVGREEE